VTSLINRIVMALARGVLLIAAMTAVPVLAQEPAPPRDVNDCTFLRDPTRVRQCIESFQGSVQTPDVVPPSPSLPMLTPPVTPPATPTQPPSATPPVTPIQPPPQAPPPRLAPR